MIRSLLRILLIGLLLLGQAGMVAAARPEPKHVLVLHSYHAGFSWTDSIQAGIQEAFSRRANISLYVEYLDAKRNPSPEYRDKLLPKLLASKLAGKTFDLLLVSDNVAFDFALHNRQSLFAGLPIVFCGVNNFSPRQLSGQQGITGVAEFPSFRETLETARRLHPGTREFIFINNRGEITGDENRQLIDQVHPLMPGIRFTHWENLHAGELQRRLARLQPGQVVVLTAVVTADDGQVMDFPQSARFVRANCPVPVYGLWDFFLGNGIVGGKLINGRDQGRQAAKMALKVLDGTPPAQLPVVDSEANAYQFDYRELVRFGVDPSALPSGSRLVHEPPSIYAISSTHARILLGVFIAVLLLSGVMGAYIVLRRKTALALEEHSRFLQVLLDSLPLAIFYKDRQGRYLGCNQSMARLLGRSKEEVVGCTVHDLYPSEQAELYQLADEELYGDDSEPQVYESVMQGAGQNHDVLISKNVFQDTEGRIAGLVGSILDLTERKRAERAREESERYNRMLFEHSPIGFVVHGEDGTIVDVNSGFARIIGFPVQEVLHSSLKDFVPDRLWSGEQQLIGQVQLSGHYGPVELELIHRDGHLVPVRLSGIHFTRGDGSFVLSSVEDVSARYRANEALRQSEKRFRTTFETCPDAICINRLKDGLYIEVNRGFAELTGYRRDEVIGRSAVDMALWEYPAERDRLVDQLTRDGSVSSHEAVFRFRDKSCATVLISCRLIQIAGETCIVSVIKNIEAMKRSQEVLRISEERFRVTFETSPDGLSINRLFDGSYLEINEGFCQLMGYAKEEVLGYNTRELGIWADEEQLKNYVHSLVRVKSLQNFESQLRRKNGEIFPALLSGAMIDVQGEQCVVTMFRDISDLKNSQRQLSESERRYRQIFENIQDIYYESSLDGTILEISPSVENELGYSRQELIGTSFVDIYFEAEERNGLLKALLQHGRVNDYEIRLRHRQGQSRLCAINAMLAAGINGVERRIIGSMRDITARKNAEEETRHLAYYDTLTGLPNRTLFNDRLDQALQQSRRHGDLLAVLFLDLDRFKDINDTSGHAAGDQLLRITAQRLLSCIRSSDTVARLGGDEFVLLLTGIHHEREVLLVAQKVLRLMAAPFDLGDHEAFTSTSIGIVLSPVDGQDVDGLMKHADMAMYAAKEQGRNTYKFFSREMNRKAQERHVLETSLRRAMKQQEIYLEYQPQMDLASGRLVGVEALLRWNAPDRGIIPPDRFVPMAEETGLIHPLGEWVLRTACRQCREWEDAGLGAIKMAVNLSGYQFKQPDFLDRVESILVETGLSPELLEMELTESVLMEHARETISVLTDLKIRGIKLAIDDFGTGYSSLSYLKNFPIDRIKIDRSFVRDITTDPNDAAIVETIIAMARSLRLRVVAEGVETREQLEFLRERHCDELQGYYLGRPMSPEKIAELWRADRAELPEQRRAALGGVH